MSDHKTEHDWIVPNLLRRTGWHVVIGDDAATVAAALFQRALAAGASALLSEPRWTGLFWDLHWNPECALRNEHCVITVANDLWYQPERWLAEADVGLRVQGGTVFPVHGGMPNARPVEVATLVPIKMSSEQPVQNLHTSAAKPKPFRDNATIARRFRPFSEEASKPKPFRPYGWQRRGWRKRVLDFLDRMHREAWERDRSQP